MKRKDLIRELEQLGCVLYRHGGRHDIYLNTVTYDRESIHQLWRLNGMK